MRSILFAVVAVVAVLVVVVVASRVVVITVVATLAIVELSFAIVSFHINRKVLIPWLTQVIRLLFLFLLLSPL